MRFNESVNALIVKERKLLTVQRRPYPWPKMYVMPGGKIKNKESELDALRREVKEETGYNIEIEHHIVSERFYYKMIPFYISIYKASIIGGQERTDDKDILDIKWMDYDSFIENLKNRKFKKKYIKKIETILSRYI